MCNNVFDCLITLLSHYYFNYVSVRPNVSTNPAFQLSPVFSRGVFQMTNILVCKITESLYE